MGNVPSGYRSRQEFRQRIVARGRGSWRRPRARGNPTVDRALDGSVERLLQYLDDIDDLAGALGLQYERCRRLLLNLLRTAIGLLVTAAAFWLALAHPIIALVTCLLLVVTLAYRLHGHGNDGKPKSV